jgi:hypothetical protein
MKKLWIFLLIVILIAAGGYVIYLHKRHTALLAKIPPPAAAPQQLATISDQISNPPPADTDSNVSIIISSPTPGQTISSPLMISGRAKGEWFGVDGTFPITLLDANGQTISEATAAALDAWATDDFVDFNATLEFTATTSATGTIIFAKDNPSGLPQDDLNAEVPIVFGPPSASSSSSTSTASGSSTSSSTATTS